MARQPLAPPAAGTRVRAVPSPAPWRTAAARRTVTVIQTGTSIPRSVGRAGPAGSSSASPRPGLVIDPGDLSGEVEGQDAGWARGRRYPLASGTRRTCRRSAAPMGSDRLATSRISRRVKGSRPWHRHRCDRAPGRVTRPEHGAKLVLEPERSGRKSRSAGPARLVAGRGVVQPAGRYPRPGQLAEEVDVGDQELPPPVLRTAVPVRARRRRRPGTVLVGRPVTGRWSATPPHRTGPAGAAGATPRRRRQPHRRAGTPDG